MESADPPQLNNYNKKSAVSGPREQIGN
jgi:hypothetical protein